MPSRRFIRRVLSTGVVLAVSVGPFIASPVAHGDPIGDLRSRANEVSQQISDLENQIATETHAMEQARYEGTLIDERIEVAEAKLAEARNSEAAGRKELSRYALQAYVSGGSDTNFAAVVGTEGDKIGRRNGYVSAAVGDRQQLVDSLEALQKNTEDQKKELQAARAEAKRVEEETEARYARVKQAAAELQRTKSQLDGKLAQMVAEKQAAEARAAEARARAEAERQARREAARAAAATPAAPSPSVSVTIPEPTETPSEPTDQNPTVEQPTVAPPSSGRGGAVVAAAQSQLGVPYRWGGTSPGVGLDCSGLTQFAYRQAGVSIPRVTYAQMGAGQTVPLSAIQPGDLVFYSGGSHVAIYVGGGQVIHAPQTGDVVKYSSLYMMPPQLVVRP